MSNREHQPVVIMGHTIPEDESNQENPSDGEREVFMSPCKFPEKI